MSVSRESNSTVIPELAIGTAKSPSSCAAGRFAIPVFELRLVTYKKQFSISPFPMSLSKQADRNPLSLSLFLSLPLSVFLCLFLFACMFVSRFDFLSASYSVSLCLSLSFSLLANKEKDINGGTNRRHSGCQESINPFYENQGVERPLPFF